MTSEADICLYVYTDQLTVVSEVVQASDLPFTPITTKVFVEIAVGNLRRRTESIKQKENTCTRWDARLVLYASIHPSTHCMRLTYAT